MIESSTEWRRGRIEVLLDELSQHVRMPMTDGECASAMVLAKEVVEQLDWIEKRAILDKIKEIGK